MGGFCLKSHTGATTGMAQMLNAAFPHGPQCVASYTMNPANGGINPCGLEVALAEGAKWVWFPTYGTRRHIEIWGTGVYPLPAGFKGYDLEDEGALLWEAVTDCLKLIADAGAVLASGHLSPRECLMLFRKATDLGISRLVFTHPSEPVTAATLDEQREAAKLGVIMEHCLLAATPSFNDGVPMQAMADQIKAVGVENCIVTSDLGQVANGPVVAGFAGLLQKLSECGVSEDEIKTLISRNPRKLLEGLL